MKISYIDDWNVKWHSHLKTAGGIFQMSNIYVLAALNHMT